MQVSIMNMTAVSSMKQKGSLSDWCFSNFIAQK